MATLDDSASVAAEAPALVTRVVMVTALLIGITATGVLALDALTPGGLSWPSVVLKRVTPALMILGWAVALWLWSAAQTRPLNSAVPVSLAAGIAILLGAPPLARCLGDQEWPMLGVWLVNLFGGGVDPDVLGPSAALPQCQGALPVSFQTARLLGLSSVVLGALAGLGAVFREQVERAKVRWASDVDLVIGLNPQSLNLVRALVDERRAHTWEQGWYRPNILQRLGFQRRPLSGVVLVHPRGNDPLIGEARSAGALVYVDDPTSARVLGPIIRRWGNRTAVRSLFAVDESQQVNLTVIERAGAIIASTLDRPATLDPSLWLASEWVPRLVARMEDPREARDWRLRHLNTPGCLTDALSSHQLLARSMADAIAETRCHEENCSDGCGGSPCRQVVICGDSPLAIALLDELALQRTFRDELARVATGGNQPPARLEVEHVTVAGAEAGRNVAEWLAHASPAARAEGAFSVSSTDESWDDVVLRVGANGIPIAVVIANRPTEEVLSIATRITRGHSHALVFAPGQGIDGLGQGVALPNESLVRYGPTVRQGNRPPEDSWTVLARQQHEYYRLSNGNVDVGRGSRRPWYPDESGRRAPEFVRDDNIRQLRLVLQNVPEVIGPWRTVRATDEPRPLRPTEITTLARLEHQRWSQMRRANGWTFEEFRGSGDPADDERARAKAEERRRNRNLIEWDTGEPILGPGRHSDATAQPIGPLHEANAYHVTVILDRLRQWGIEGQPSGVTEDEARPRSYRRAGEVRATPLSEVREWVTSEGEPLTSHPGDWWVTGADGVSRGVAAQEFGRLYEHLADDRYRRTGQVVARRATSAETVVSLEGPMVAQPGMWIVTAPPGNSWAVPDTDFRRGYTLADPLEEDE